MATVQAGSPSSSAGTAVLYGVHHRWVILGVGAAAQASFAAAFAGLPVTGVLMRSAYQMTTQQLGLVLGCMALGIMLSEIVWGVLTDLLGDRRVLLTGLVSTASVLATIALFLVPSTDHVPSYLLLGSSLVLVGILGGSVNPSSGRAIMGWFTDGKRGLAMSIRQTAIPVGGGIGAALLPWLANSYGFQSVFSALSLFCIFSALATWLWLHEHEAPDQTAATTNAQTVEHRSPLRRTDIWRLAFASGLLTVPQLAVLTFAGVFLHDEKDASIPLIAGTILAVQVAGSIARILIGQRSDRGGDRRTLIRRIGLMTMLVTAGLASLTFKDTHWVVLFLWLSGLFASAWHGVAYTEIAVMAGPRRAGTALGIIGMTIFTSAFLTPALIPLVLSHSSWQMVWGLVSVAALLAVVVCPRGQSKVDLR